jgi:hypothetical protein
MPVVARGQVLGLALPALVFFHQVTGTLVDLYALKFQIFDVSDETKFLAPVQVFPVTPAAKQTVDISGVDRLGVGRYIAAGWTVSATAPVGTYEIRWFFTPAVGDTEVEVRQPFEVLAAGSVPIAAPFYGSLRELRDEGVTVTQASDARLIAAILRASAYVNRITGRDFSPRYKLLRLDGRGGSVQLLWEPIIALETLHFSTSPLFPSDLQVQADFYRVYNRHLSGLNTPDDRDDPKVELFRSSEDLQGIRPFTFSRLIFPKGQHNVEAVGVFGYTEADGSPFGVTPTEIRRVTHLLTLREIPKLMSCSREETLSRYRIKSEKTRDQSYDLEGLKDLGRIGRFTGDPEIDSILAAYLRPPMMGAA